MAVGCDASEKTQLKVVPFSQTSDMIDQLEDHLRSLKKKKFFLK